MYILMACGSILSNYYLLRKFLGLLSKAHRLYVTLLSSSTESIMVQKTPVQKFSEPEAAASK
jgi:hypothetical protein